MGRRNRSKRNGRDDDDVDGGHDGDYSLERTEKEWLLRRLISKRGRGGKEEEEEEDLGGGGGGNDGDDGDDHDDRDVVGKKKKKKMKISSDELLSPSMKTREEDDAMRRRTGPMMDANHHPPTASIVPAMDDKIERTRLKRRLQKERRREKKMAMMASSAASAGADDAYSRKAERLVTTMTKSMNGTTTTRKQPGHDGQFVTLARGVRCMDLSIGKGPIVVHRKNVRVSYTLRSKSHASGKVLDSSGNFGFHFGKGEVIKGWDIGLVGMKVGGIRRLVVPPSAGYGNRDVGAGSGGDLYFQIELLHVAP